MSDEDKDLIAKALTLSGLTNSQSEYIDHPGVNPSDVFAELNRTRESGELAKAIAPDTIRYQTSIILSDIVRNVAGLLLAMR